MSGVYQIYNPITNKRYIGSSINIENRFKLHIRKLKKGTHCNLHLQNAWNKYSDQLKFEILEYCEPDDLIATEQYYIDYYNSADRRYGYNIDKHVSHFGHSLSFETKEKIRQKALGRRLSQDTIEKIKLAITGKKKPKLSKTMKDKYANGYKILRFCDFPKDKLIEWRYNLSEAQKKRYSNYMNRPEGYYLKAVADNGTISYYPSLREAARLNNVDKGTITYALKYKMGRINKIKLTFYRIYKEEFCKIKVNNKGGV